MTLQGQPSQRQTTEQKRAYQAWQSVESIQKEDKKVRGEYGTQARKLAAMIQINGLANTVAFHKSKDNVAQSRLMEHLEAWLQIMLKTDQNLMNYIMETSTENYRRATSEAIVFAGWLKRFVDAKGWKSSEGG